jgi:transcriptional regulator with XRE-family HTH domain
MPARKANGHHRGALHLYRSYNFVDKDPVIDRVRTIINREGLKYGEIEKLSSVSSTTLHNWFEGKTRKPQYATIAAVVGAMGYHQKFVKSRQVDFVKEIAKAAAEIAELKEKLERKQQRAASGS